VSWRRSRVRRRALTGVPAASRSSSGARAARPWLLTALPPDDRQAKLLIAELQREIGDGRLVVAAAIDHDSHAALVACRRELLAHGLVPKALVEFDSAEADPGPLAARLVGSEPPAVLVIAPARPAAALVGELRRRGFGGTIAGSAALGRNAFFG
jgi:ABC-type branched-subunit amino acid transport system substrate-binding protein